MDALAIRLHHEAENALYRNHADTAIAPVWFQIILDGLRGAAAGGYGTGVFGPRCSFGDQACTSPATHVTPVGRSLLCEFHAGWVDGCTRIADSNSRIAEYH